MTPSAAEPRPVPVRRYRYSKWRWRILVRALDILGAMLVGLWRRFRAAPEAGAPSRILLIQLDHLGDAVLTSPLLPRLRAAYPDAAIDVLASATRHDHELMSSAEVDLVRHLRRLVSSAGRTEAIGQLLDRLRATHSNIELLQQVQRDSGSGKGA